MSSDGNGSTSYDLSYANSYSYDSTNNDVHKWDYESSAWAGCANTYCTSPSSSDSSYVSHLTAANSTAGGDNYASYYWYSASLSNDGNGSTSYDYSYTNSYSYDSTNADVHKWDYDTSACANTYCTSSSSSDSSYVSHLSPENSTAGGDNYASYYWYSASLSSDGNGSTSYDYSY